MEQKEEGRRAKSARRGEKAAAAPARAASAASAPMPAGGGGWFVKVQGNAVEMIESKERPSTVPAMGEALIELIGPFLSGETCKSVLERMASRLLGAGPRERGRGDR